MGFIYFRKMRMIGINKSIKYIIIALLISILSIGMWKMDIMASDFMMTEPMLQNPGKDSVYVQWFTEGEGNSHEVLLFENGPTGVPTRTVEATTVKMSRLRGGKSEATANDASIDANIYKHIALVEGLPVNKGKNANRVLYKIVSDGKKSRMYSLASNQDEGVDIKVLLTSDHQIKQLCAANIEKVIECVGRVDAIWMAGDIVDVSDRAYDWFYADNAFIKVMTGQAGSKIGGETYKGAPLLQYAPIYTAIGNHDVMGVYSKSGDLSVQFNSPIPREVARKRLEAKGDFDELSLQDASYNTITYEEMFELPKSENGGEKWYAKSMGDIRLVSLDASRVWKLPNLGMVGKFTEWPGATEDMYGYGDFIFESMAEGSPQIEFLKSELESKEYKDAAIKVVMFHEEAHSLGGNKIPPFTDPVAGEVKDPVTGLKMVTYDYPKDKDYIETVVEPLLEKSGTDLLFNAHSHLWNRFVSSSGMNILETSNVGNNYGGFDYESKRDQYPSALNKKDAYSSIAFAWDADNYITNGDPSGLEAVKPNAAGLPGNRAYLASNTVTAFSILDTKKGTVDSYYYDTAKRDGDIVLFDSFDIR